VLAVVGLTVVTWPALPLTAASGSENSWVIGLSLALARGVSFATRVVFTYGPLGPVLHPIDVSGETVALGVLGAGILHVALVTVLLCTLRPRVGLLAGAALTLLAVLVVTASSVVDVLDAIAFGIVALSLARPMEESAGAAQALAIGGGVFSALALLTELNQGVAVTAIVAVGLVGGARPGRNLAIGALSLLVTLVCAWLALGQPLGAIPDYVSNGIKPSPDTQTRWATTWRAAATAGRWASCSHLHSLCRRARGERWRRLPWLAARRSLRTC
jgi:hypothetical protein